MERDVLTEDDLQSLLNFNSHAHVERDRHGETLYLPQANFNSHAHVERDISAKLGGNKLDDFNSHAHVERDTLSARHLRKPKTFQLTRSRGA